MPGSLFERLTLGEIAESMNEDDSIRRHLFRHTWPARLGRARTI